jgi:hypothetical protein
MADDTGISPDDLSDADLERELRHLHRTREETFFNGTQQALGRHTTRMLDLEREYQRRFPDRVRPDELRTREGSRAQAGQEP